MIGSYSAYQKTLSDLVIRLRDGFGLTFRGIAEELIKNGYRSPRGFELGPESVFSIYKKRKARDARLTREPDIEVGEVRIGWLCHTPVT
jgi:hypothetical protein